MLLLLTLVGCEKVIDVDLNSTDPKVVIEGNIYDVPGPYTVRITETASFFDSNTFKDVTGATGTIRDDKGNSEILIEDFPGGYRTDKLLGIQERTYTIDVEWNGESYTASSYLPVSASLDSTIYEFQPHLFFHEEGYYVSMFITDPKNLVNAYLINVYQNGVPPDSDAGAPYYYVFDDVFFDGLQIEIDLWPFPFELNDTIIVELYTMDEVGYDYYNTLNVTLESSSGGGFSEAPQNPKTNLSDGALGYFGAYAVRRDTVIITGE